MAKAFAIHGSTTNHGGVVMATQMRSSQMGNLFLRAGDGFACPKCQCWSTLIKSNDHVIFGGKAVAYVGDKFSCGATLMPKQVHIVGDSGSNVLNAFLTQFENTENSQYQLNNHFSENKARYENYYIERNKTDYVKFKNVIIPYDEDKRGWIGVTSQSISGACEYIVTYVLQGCNLFVTVSYIPPMLKVDAKILPFGSIKIFRQEARVFKNITQQNLEVSGGVWDTEKGKEPALLSHSLI